MLKKGEFLFRLKIPLLIRGRNLQTNLVSVQIVKGTIKNITQFALFIGIKNTDLNGMVHYKDLSYDENEEDLKKFKKNQELELKILEIDKEKEKIRLGLKQLLPDPLDFFKDRNKKDIITTVIKEIVDNGIKVSPDGCNIKFLIKKNQIAVDKEDQRVTRFTKRGSE